jgi:hypothetical protein
VITSHHGTAFALWAFEQLVADIEWVPTRIDEAFLLALRMRHALKLGEDQDIALAMAKIMSEGGAEVVEELVNRAGLE